MEVSSAQYVRILEVLIIFTALSPAIDQVMVGNVERTRPGDIRVLFFEQ